MTKFKRIETGIDGLVVIEPTVFGDHRGFFMEAYNKEDFEEIGLHVEFVQDNHSKSKKGVLRGLHFQTKNPQGKLVRVTRGSVWDAAVDLREGSPTYGNWRGVLLSEANKRMFYVPDGFAHGFLTLEDDTEFLYKCTDYYRPDYDAGITYRDPEIGINWPLEQYDLTEEELRLSHKDKQLPTLAQLIEQKKEKRH
ncbi:dTDP-4-dehydrorhamnose 3,5-epimerase [Marinicrinis sediminis]|uniref:dTDP-4-dehydrorhamnose 3,5-epimerase n=1 Tax=Marinicrinis sediminis TaxID=1652465 RepID=A0ABW5RAE3_9BACL